MDTELLKTFLEVTQTRHFGRAADNLYVTPAAVSARIRQLEQMLGVSLLYRTRGNIQVTSEGERLVPHAQQLLEIWNLARQDMAHQAVPEGHLRLGATPGLWRFVLSRVVDRLRQGLPDMKLRAEAYPQDDLLERLLADQLDMVVVYDVPGEAALKARKVGQLRLAMLSSGAGETLKSALAEDYIHVEWGAAFALFHARRVGEVHAHLYTNQASIALDALRRGPASAYLPVHLADRDLRPVVDAPEFSRPLYAVYRADQEGSPAIRAAVEALTQLPQNVDPTED